MAERRVAGIQGALVAVMGLLRNNGNIALADGHQQGNLVVRHTVDCPVGAGPREAARTGPQTEPLETEIVKLQRRLNDGQEHIINDNVKIWVVSSSLKIAFSTLTRLVNSH